MQRSPSHRTVCSAVGLALAATLSPPLRAQPATFRGPSWMAMQQTLRHPTSFKAEWVPGPLGSVIPNTSWHDNSSNEDGFTIEWWRNDPQAGSTLLGTFTAPANATRTFLIPTGPPYVSNGDRFRVRAFNAVGVSSWSNWDTIP